MDIHHAKAEFLCCILLLLLGLQMCFSVKKQINSAGQNMRTLAVLNLSCENKIHTH